MWKKLTLAALAIGILFPLPSHAAENAIDREAASTAAREWLQLVDNERYDASWDSTSAYFKSKLDKPTWMHALSSLRHNVGPVTSRTEVDVKLEKWVPEDPNREFYVLSYDSSFKNKHNCRERITMMKDDDGTYRMSGYFIKN